MTKTLEKIIRSVKKKGRSALGQLDNIRKNYLEPYLIPATIGGALLLESSQLAKMTEETIVENEASIRVWVQGGQLALEYMAPYFVELGLAAAIVFPATAAMHKYCKRKKIKITKTIKKSSPKVTAIKKDVQEDLIKAYDFLTQNRVINNRAILPITAGTGMLHLGLSGMIDGVENLSPLEFIAGAFISGLGIKTANNLYRYFRGKRPIILPRTGSTASMPLIYLLSAGAVGYAARETETIQVGLPSLPDSDIVFDSNKKLVRGREGYIIGPNNALSYWDAAGYWGKYYGVDPTHIRAFLAVESNMHHFSKNGGIVTSRVGAIGIGQHMPSNIANLNNWIDLKQLKGNKFSLEKVRNIPSENIRATAATIRNLIDVSDACSNKSEETIGCVIETAARYNAGSGAVERAQKLAGSNNVWRVLNHLPLETEGHARRSAIYFWVYKKGLFWPTRGTEISSNYGSRWSGKHKGMDINPGHPGDPIYAIQDGVVANRHRDSINGYFVTVIHGPAMLGFYSGYAHGMAGSTRVNIGDKVDSGEILMSEGNTGRVRGQRGGYHLHLATYFRYRHKNRIITEYFDPMSLYKFFTGSMGRDITHVPQL